MYTINIKGKPYPKDLSMAKLEMIFFKTEHTRASIIVNVTQSIDRQEYQVNCVYF